MLLAAFAGAFMQDLEGCGLLLLLKKPRLPHLMPCCRGGVTQAGFAQMCAGTAGAAARWDQPAHSVQCSSLTETETRS